MVLLAFLHQWYRIADPRVTRVQHILRWNDVFDTSFGGRRDELVLLSHGEEGEHDDKDVLSSEHRLHESFVIVITEHHRHTIVFWDLGSGRCPGNDGDLVQSVASKSSQGGLSHITGRSNESDVLQWCRHISCVVSFASAIFARGWSSSYTGGQKNTGGSTRTTSNSRLCSSHLNDINKTDMKPS